MTVDALSARTLFFSIIIPTYNCHDKLEQSLASVFAQECGLCEVVVIDGGSTDGTAQLLEKHQDVLTWVSEPDQGVYDAMNKGIQRASGSYLYFLGAGDCLQEDVLHQLLPTMLDRPMMIYGNAYYASTGETYGGEFSKARLNVQNLCHQTIFYHKTVFERVGLYELKYKFWADYKLNLKCFANQSITKKYVNAVIATYEGNGLSWTHEDEVFLREKHWLVLRYLGLREYMRLNYLSVLKVLRSVRAGFRTLARK